LVQFVFCILLIVAGETILKRSFGDAYGAYWPVLVVLGLNQLLAKLALAPGRALLLVERANIFLWAEVKGFAITVVAATMLTPHYGVLGAAFSLVAGSLFMTAWILSAYFTAMRDDKGVVPLLIGRSPTPAAGGVSK
jgi:O-antigen/teichoic acid export membrane protein